MLSIKVDAEKCDGCGRCVAVCQVGVELANKRYNAGVDQPLLRIVETGKARRIDICRHCEIPVCADACVAGAIAAAGESGVVQLSADKCVGCFSCVMECPFGALRLTGGHAFKCDGCRTLDMPLCARFCPTGALLAAPGRTGPAARRRERASTVGRPGR